MSQEQTIALLSRSDTYGAGVTEVRRIETHASVLFLAGDRAYKLKRAVRFSYLDYSTPELRRRACEREVALNRRTAPELYLGVGPITRRAGALSLGGAGEPVDWVVEMRRFDEGGLFDRMAEEGRLTQRLMRDLADSIAEFHDIAEIDLAAGGAAAIAAVVAGNDRNLRAAPDGFDPGAVDRLRDRCGRELERIAPLLDRRRAEGRVRLCHGDLHLRNICLIDGRPILFDCIEFSEEIARIDVLYDLAFLLMDLEHRGLVALANQVLNRYLDRRDESGGLRALPLFQSLRAAIRAHTGAAAAARQSDPQRAAAMREDNAAYLALALALLEPVPPVLIAIGGLSGTGKTTLAYELAPDLGRAPGARVLRSDVLRKRLHGVAPETRLAPEAYAPECSHAVYRALCEEAAGALASGQAAIVDAVFLRPEERAAIAEVATDTGVPFLGLWLEAPPDILEARLEGRRGDASDATAEVMHSQRSLEAGRIEWLRIDAAPQEPRQVLDDARAALAEVRP
jgi:uncharacterized protein